MFENRSGSGRPARGRASTSFITIGAALALGASIIAGPNTASARQSKSVTDQTPRVFESALVVRAAGSPTAFIKLCKSCKRFRAKMTPQTKVFEGDARRPLSYNIDIHADTELMFDPKTESIVWLWIR